jgi:phosphate-selective porin OprO/OprP
VGVFSSPLRRWLRKQNTGFGLGHLRYGSVGPHFGVALVLACFVFAGVPARAEPGPKLSSNPWVPALGLSEDGVRLDWGKWAELSIGGLFQGDWGYIQKDAFATPSGWDSQVRRARFDTDGLIAGHFLFRFEGDVSFTRGRLAEPDLDYKDIYIGFQGLGPLGTFRVGHMKELYSLQHLTYAGDRTFMEESLTTAFTPGRSFGMTLSNHILDQRMTWAIGGFQKVTDDSSFFGKKGDWDVGLRLTGLAIYEDEGRKLLHFGGAYIATFRDDDATLIYEQRPEANIANPLPRTTAINVRAEHIFGTEMVGIYGPFYGHFESSVVWQDRKTGKTTHTKSAFLEFGAFLTGEHRPYDPEQGIFSRVRPDNPVSIRGGGWGAWQLAVRMSFLDLNTNVTADSPRPQTYPELGVSLNWFLRSSLRLDANYLYLLEDGGSSLFMMRAQIAF